MEQENTRLLEKARSTVSRGLDMIDACITELDRQLQSDGYEIRTAAHLATMIDHVVRMLGALRMLEKHDTLLLEKLTPIQQDQSVVSYLAELPMDRRAAFRKIIDELDEQERLLG